MTSDRRVVLSVRELAIRVRGAPAKAGPNRTLLAPTSFNLFEGERVLLLGPSGAGKSLFSDVLLGFLPEAGGALDVSGSLTLDGRELLGLPAEGRAGRLGGVFQLQAAGLFDDLSAEQNLRFGSADAGARTDLARRLGLEQLERPVPLLSGGERVRLSLARTLLAGSDVILADEPTTGLDPTSARHVVEALAAAHRRLTLVVTHDLSSFEAFADVVLLLDPAQHSLSRLSPGPETQAAVARVFDTWGALTSGAPGPGAAESPPRRRMGLLQRGTQAWIRRSAATADALGDAASLLALPRTLLDAGHPLHGPRVRSELRRCLAPGVTLFVGLSAVLVSLTATFFLFERLPQRAYSEPLVQDELLSGLGLVLARVVVPLIASILLAAKLGASASAHLGHLSLTRQVDALRLLNLSPRRHLLLPVALAQLLAAWWHTALAILLAYVTTAAVFLWQHPGWSALYARTAWRRGLDWDDLPWEAGKVGLCALAVAVTAYRAATARRLRAPAEVVGALHRTLLVGLLLVLVIHAAFAFVEF